MSVKTKLLTTIFEQHPNLRCLLNIDTFVNRDSFIRGSNEHDEQRKHVNNDDRDDIINITKDAITPRRFIASFACSIHILHTRAKNTKAIRQTPKKYNRSKKGWPPLPDMEAVV